MKFHGIVMQGNFICLSVGNIGALGAAGTKGKIIYVESENAIYVDTGTEWRQTGLDPALFGNNTILGSVTAETPVPISASVNTVIGRMNVGNVKALSTTELTSLIAASTTTSAGSITLATSAEAITGTNTTKSITPQTLSLTLASSAGVNVPFLAQHNMSGIHTAVSASSISTPSVSATVITGTTISGTNISASSIVTNGISAGTFKMTTAPSASAYIVSDANGNGTWQRPSFARGGTLVNTVDYLSAMNVPVWYATYACRVTNVRGYRVGGGATTSINARKNGASNHLATAKTLANPDTWYDAGAVQNTDYSIGDKLEIMMVVPGASASQIAIQVDFVRI